MDVENSALSRLLRQMDHTFTNMTGQTISFIDQEGQWQSPLHLDRFTAFCRHVVNSDSGRERCQSCNHSFGLCTGKGLNVMRCHMGVSVISVPVPITGKQGLILSYGQFLTQDTKAEFYEMLEQNCAELKLDYRSLRDLAGTLRVLTQEELDARIQLLKLFAAYISSTEAELRTRQEYTLEVERKLALEHRLRSMEFKFLQSQISPHFLFNTLNLLMRSAYREHAEHTADLICDLSDLLRRAYHPKNSLCTLEEELVCVEKYLTLQQQRLGPEVTFQIRCEPDCKQIMIPVLTIQPLAENAIIHGLDQDTRPMYIHITATRRENQLVITIADTGAGIPASVLKQLEQGTCARSGLGNVADRLRLFFGPGAEIKISCVQDSGAKIQLLCPLDGQEVVSNG